MLPNGQTVFCNLHIQLLGDVTLDTSSNPTIGH